MLSTRALRSEVQIHLHKLKTSCARAGFCAPHAQLRVSGARHGSLPVASHHGLPAG